MVYAPATMQEVVDLMETIFDNAKRDRNPVGLLLDGNIGGVMEPVIMPGMRSKTKYTTEDWELSGCEGRQSRCLLPFSGTIKQLPELLAADSQRMLDIYASWDENDVLVEEINLDDAEYVLTAYGTSARTAKTVMKNLRKAGHKVGMIRPITVSPFPKKSFRQLDENKVKVIIDIEMTQPGQMLEDVKLSVEGKIPVEFVGNASGIIVTDADIYKAVSEIIGRCS